MNFTSTNAAQGSSDSNIESEPLLPVYAWVLIGIGGALSILAVGIVLKRRRRRSTAHERAWLNTNKPIDVFDAPSISDNTWYDQPQASDKSINLAPQENETLLPRMESDENDAVPHSSKSDENDTVPPGTEAQDSPNVKLDDKDDAKLPTESQDDPVDTDNVSPPEVEETSGDESSDEENPNTLGNDETTVKIKN